MLCLHKSTSRKVLILTLNFSILSIRNLKLMYIMVLRKGTLGSEES
jgi:hypothetical protein